MARVGTAWRLQLAAGRYRSRESLFVVPALIMAGGLVLALVTGWIDRTIGADRPVPLTLGMSANAATWLLSTVAGAMITTVGVVFSLTVVSLQLASSQFSPRVMRSFVRDRLSQAVIGFLVATFVYCVLTLPEVSGEATDPAPRVSLTVAIVLTLVTVVLIIAHLDHLARHLQVGQILEGITAEGLAVVAATARPTPGLTPDPDARLTPPADAHEVPCPVGGWVSQVDGAMLLRAVPPGTTVRLETRVGAYIHAGEPLVTVWPAVSPQVEQRLVAAIDVTDSRTMQQDADFALRQIVDIGLRALSSAINDPTTAVEATLRVGSLLREVLVTAETPTALRDDSGRVLVRPWDLDLEEYIEHGFDQLRHAAPAQPLVAAAFLRVVRMLIAHARDFGREEHVPALARQNRLLLDALAHEPGLHPADLAWLRDLAGEDTDPADHSAHPDEPRPGES